jgi:predicted ribosomally synthesized peptide with nif11-like leader
MSIESATQFLKDVNWSWDLREKFQEVATPEEFIDVATQLGYNFTTEELEQIAHEYSEGAKVRRGYGVWAWLRTVNWIRRDQPQNAGGEE